MVKRKVPNVVRGGIAIPLGNNYYYMRGRKHEYGGIDIGENPRTGIEVEDKEVVHVGNNDLKVYSAQPFLGGLSPAERIIRGDNPIDVFNAQEDYKRRNKLNDDGTRKKRNGGLNRSKDYGSKSKPYPSIKSKDFAGKNRSYPIPTKADAIDALRLAGLHGRSDVKAKVYRRYPELRKKAELGIETKNYRNGGIYSVTSNGKTSLRYLPKLESSEYKKFDKGGTKTLDFDYFDKNPKPIGDATLNVTYNPNYTMQLAEDRNPRIKRDKQRTIRRNARTRTGSPLETFGLDMMDLIGAGANTLASLAGFAANRRMLNNMKYTAQPNLETAAKLKTNYNINPRLAAVREGLAQTINDVNRNTSSSNVALARNQAALNNALLTADQLYALKENEETKLINADRMNRQEVANKNIQSYNEWLKDKTEFENNIRELKSENEVGLYNNLNSAVQNVVNNILKRRSDDNTITAMMAANPDLPIEILEDLGLITHAQAKMYRKQYPLKKD